MINAAPRILVVDDMAANRELMAGQLEHIGCDVKLVSNGRAALDAVELALPDLVLLDVAMPGISGLDVCRAIKARPASQMVPVVLVTGQGELEDRVRGFNAGADDVLVKPVALSELEARVVSLLEAKVVRDGLDAAEEVMASLALALDARSPYTREHSSRVALLALALGRAAGLEGQELEDLYQGGLIHDIGKIGLPDRVLIEDGPLDAEMLSLVKLHPINGAEIIAPLKSARRLGPIVRHHHERYDGAGYPDGLARNRIPLAARIVAVCDAFDAMVSDRPYRPALTMESAIERLAFGAGRQWDPSLVRLFVAEVVGTMAEVA